MNAATENIPNNKRSGLKSLFLMCGLTGGAIFFITYSVFGLETPNYNMFRETISSLELVRHGWIQQVNFIFFGILNIGFAIALAEALEQNWYARVIVFLQALSGIALIGDGFFIYEPMHLVCDLVTFNSSLLVLFLFTRPFSRNPSWRGWIVYSILTAITMMLFLTAFGIANKNHGLAGLYERLAVLPRSIWSIILAGKLLRGKKLVNRPPEHVST